MTKAAPFHGFIGQRTLIPLIKHLVEGSKAAGRPLPHMLITGSSGLGKSELARAIATAKGSKLHRFTADKTLQISQVTEGLASDDMVFIDEAHAITVQAQEAIYDHLDAKTANIAHPESPIPECCFIVATDQPSKLRNAFRKRFVQTLHLQPYGEEELIDIIASMSGSEGLLLTPQARRLLARTSQGIPRVARHHIQSLACFGSISITKTVEQSILKEYLDEVGLDDQHRTRLQQRYLSALQGTNQGVASLAMLAGLMACEAEQIGREIEPFLIQQGWAEITSKGRRLTNKGRESLVPAAVTDTQQTTEVTP